jgi:hypothetical protein
MLASLAVLVAAAPAAAIVHPWSPLLGRPSIDGPVRASTAPVIDAAREHLGVLRREQTDTDRTQASSLLATLGRQTQGVQTDGIRSLAPGWALIPVQSLQIGTETKTNQICLSHHDGLACGAADKIASDGLSLASASPSGTTIAGVVPDSVARVRFIPTDGKPTEVDVQSNFYKLTTPDLAPSPPVNAPPGYPTKTVPGPPLPVQGEVTWLDASGSTVGPAQP